MASPAPNKASGCTLRKEPHLRILTAWREFSRYTTERGVTYD
jgi:hypothetical protein